MYPPISNIKIDDIESVNETKNSGDSERDLIDQIQPTPIVISPPVSQPKKKIVKKVVKKAAPVTRPACAWTVQVNNKVTKVNETDSKIVKEAKAEVAASGKRLACTGKTLIAVGAIGSLCAIWTLFGARHIVAKILSHQEHGGQNQWRGHHGGQGHQWGGNHDGQQHHQWKGHGG